MTTYRFLNADHTLVLRDENTVIQWDPRTNAPTERMISSGPANSQLPPPQPTHPGPEPARRPPPLQPIQTPPNEVDEPPDVLVRRDNVGAVRTGEDVKPPPPPDETKLWHDAGSPTPTEMVRTPGAGAPQMGPSRLPMYPFGRHSPEPVSNVLEEDARDYPMFTLPGGGPTGAAMADLTTALDQLEKALPSMNRNTLAGLSAQVAALTEVVLAMQGRAKHQKETKP